MEINLKLISIGFFIIPLLTILFIFLQDEFQLLPISNSFLLYQTLYLPLFEVYFIDIYVLYCFYMDFFNFIYKK